ncbi:hypothetical protein BH09ACT5_BH09ACT5_02060 [soil metagenome]
MMRPKATRALSPVITVRRAGPADAEEIASIHVTAWQEAYSHLVDAQKLAALNPADRVARWRDILVGSDQKAWIAERDGVPVGWATTSERDGTVQPRALELNGIYVLSRAYGSGAGQALLNEAAGESPAYLWVASDNPRAQAFYRRNGFAPDGATDEYQLLGTPVAITRWVR